MLMIASGVLSACGAKFSPSAWRSVNTGLNSRAAMAGDLIRTDRLKGLSRQQVVSLLGEPNRPGYNYFPDSDLVYDLGPERGWMSIDDEWLLIDLDRNGRVSRAQIGRD